MHLYLMAICSKTYENWFQQALLQTEWIDYFQQQGIGIYCILNCMQMCKPALFHPEEAACPV